MDARAAGRLEGLGFDTVYRYAPGKADWRAAGLPMDGSLRPALRAMDVLRRDVPVCPVDAAVGETRRTMQAADDAFCLVLDRNDLVLGRVRARTLGGVDDHVAVQDVMEPGPATIRPDEGLAALVARMQQRRVWTIIVTDPDGRLRGVLYREDAERVLRGRAATP